MKVFYLDWTHVFCFYGFVFSWWNCFLFLWLFFYDEIGFKVQVHNNSTFFFSQLPTRGLNSFKFQVPDSPIYEKNKGAWEVGQALWLRSKTHWLRHVLRRPTRVKVERKKAALTRGRRRASALKGRLGSGQVSESWRPNNLKNRWVVSLRIWGVTLLGTFIVVGGHESIGLAISFNWRCSLFGVCRQPLIGRTTCSFSALLCYFIVHLVDFS